MQYAELINKVQEDMIFFNINDLKFISKYFRYQTEFIHYISQRIKANKYINKFYLYDELYLFSEYKINNLQGILNNDCKIMNYDEERKRIFDMKYNIEEKEKILTGRVHPLMDKMIKQMEQEKLTAYSFIVMELLELDYEAQKFISEQMKDARELFREKKEPVHISFAIEEGKDARGIYIVLGVADKRTRDDALKWIVILGSVLKKKNPNYVVIGLLNDIENSEDSIMACMEIRKPKDGFDEAIEKVEEFKKYLEN